MMKVASFAAFAVLVSLVGAAQSQAVVELAKVNNTSITDKDLQSALAAMGEASRASILKDKNSKKQVVDGLVKQTLLLQEAEKQKLDQDAEYKDAVAAFRKQYLTNRVLQKNLAAKVTDASAKKFYENHKIKYSTDQVHAQHILVADEKLAKDLLAQAKKDGTDFQALAEKNSIDPSAKNNRGDLGYFGRDRMVSEFTEAAFNAENGEVVGPVKTSFGYHVIKVIDRKVGKALNYDEVELKVKNDLKTEVVQQFVAGLVKGAKVSQNDAAIEALK